MKYDDNNVFAKILRGEIPCKPIYEDEYVMAFNDIAPKAPVHVIVITKGKYQNIVDFDVNAKDEEIIGFNRAVSKIFKQLGFDKDGGRVIANIWPNGEPEVQHYHCHLLGGKKLGDIL